MEQKKGERTMQKATPPKEPPVLDLWHTRELIKLLDAFYSKPENRAAYEQWKAKREKGN